MKWLTCLLVAFALCLGAVNAFAVSPVRISQVYGAGGNTGATYNQDFVELFNAGPSPVSLGGWSLQYGSATGSNTTGFGTCTNCTVLLPSNAVIQPCSYYLVALATGTNGAPLPVPADATGLMNLSGTSGKVALLSQTVASGACPPAANLVDLVGYGTANCSETAPTGVLSATTAAIRNNSGLVDTDNNSADFTIGAPAPRNSATPPLPDCLATPTEVQSWGTIKAIYR